MRILLVVALASAYDVEMNPVTRVAELLQGLAKKVHADGEAEQELYTKFKCWCTKVINSKTASIEKNSARITELETFIDDLGSGKIELTSERSDLEKEIADLEKTIADATSMREKEEEDYEAAKDEMDKAIAALGSAIDTMESGMNATALTGVKSELRKAVKIGAGFLAKRDVTAIMKVLQGQDPEIPDVDPETKKKYTARSGTILEILKDMEQTFRENRDAAVATEEKAAEEHETLIGTKQELLDSTKTALLDKSKEKGARGEALATAEAERDDRQGQNDRDADYLADTKTACETKETEWAARTRVRADEIASINEAISILRSDDARDTFKKSLASQAPEFVQLQKKKHHHTMKGLALSTIRKVAASTHDARIEALSTMLAMEEPEEVDESNPFEAVIASVQTMIEDLKEEEAEDLAKKEHCEKERAEKTQEAKMTSREIDTSTETIDRLTAQIAAANKSVDEINEQVADMNSEKDDATTEREKQKAEYELARPDDVQAIELIDTAVTALNGFYERNDLSLSLAEVRRSRQPFTEGGEAPPPPPEVVTEAYGGAKGETTGVLKLLQMIKESVEADIAKADKEEEESIASYNQFITDTDASIGTLEATKADLESSIATDEANMATEKTKRDTNQDSLDTTLAYLKEIAPGCDFIAVNFETRLANRQFEIDGLNRAIATLEGARMQMPEIPNV
jgi:DNA repair exonuclease SbcCD ATPase subunit